MGVLSFMFWVVWAVVCGCLLLGRLVKLRLIVLVSLFYRFGVVV